MPDLDDLLRSDLAGTASRSVHPPDFGTVVARGRRRRTRRRATAAAACVLVALAAGGTALDRATRSAVPQPTDPRPTPHRVKTPDPALDKSAPTAEQIVDDPAAYVSEVEVSADDPRVRGVVWELCASKRCARRYTAIAVTGDGFSTRALVAVPQDWAGLTPTSAGSFLVEGPRRPFLLRPDGTRVAVGTPGSVAPFRAGEVLTQPGTYGDRLVAVDPVSGAAHVLPAAANGLRQVYADAQGRLEAVRYENRGTTPTYLWSVDGGTAWHSRVVSGPVGTILQPLPSALPATSAVLQGGDGATLFPFVAVHRGTRDGASWEGIPQHAHPRAYVGTGVVLPDGRLLVDVVGWSDDRAGRPGRPKGPYVSAGDDWSSFTRVLPDAVGSPEVSAAERTALAGGSSVDVIGTSVSPGRATVYVATQGRSVAYAIDGETLAWTPVRVR